MKSKYLLGTIVCFFSLGFISCDKNAVSYAQQLKKEKKLIAEFIKREGITVLPAFPETFKENEYVLTPSGLYFHLVEEGKGDTVRKGDLVSVRYKQKTLFENAILEEFWTTQDATHPSEIEYKISGSKDCEAWHEAIGYMKKSEAQCKIIVPSSIGFEAASKNVIPFFFEMKIKFHR